MESAHTHIIADTATYTFLFFNTVPDIQTPSEKI